MAANEVMSQGRSHLARLSSVRYWRKADIGPTGAEWQRLTQSGHSFEARATLVPPDDPFRT
jgi:hypothetical protein